ncbi:DUF4912 domain-containing protein [Limnochorda pilosa]|uniref:DUF4912 domain-containing protein n=1 Tax=Limnochorda pilosa TaxID=1555112 RepID=A0A0K2SJD2_LIMPI|nr:DUF4912 domain-containing protein [Limnochorda pilosa]BAS27137.1 hypothetical protein LIP_1280 [Limnochorda pilosa]
MSLAQLQTPALPARYGEDRVTLLVRDPEWIFAYWEITPPSFGVAAAQQACRETELEPVLRVHDLAETGPFQEIGVGEAESWYIEAGRPGHRFEAELGLRGPGGGFTLVARSNRVETPPRDPAYLTAPRVSRAQEVVLRQLRGMDPQGSPEFAERRQRLLAGLALPLAEGSPLAWVTSPGASPAGAWAPSPAADLPLEVEAELILHGRTAPTATLWLNRDPVSLRPDGSFSLRVGLPDGSFPFGLEAVSVDGGLRRTFALLVTRASFADRGAEVPLKEATSRG